MTKAKIFNIQRYAIHDGPGIRTTVFFKGCPLECRWCCNPESQRVASDLSYNSNQCIGCSTCISACSKHALTLTADTIQINRSYCHDCQSFTCTTACPSGALTNYGKYVSVDEVMAEIEKDAAFYQNSGGGMTASGGEPLLWPQFIAACFLRCQAQGFTTAVETTLQIPWKNIRTVLPYTNLFLCDIKHTQADRLRQWTKGDAKQIAHHLRMLIEANAKVLVRVPLIPGFNADENSIRAICAFVKSQGLHEISLLPFHRLGEGKYLELSRPYAFHGIKPIAKETLTTLRCIPQDYDIRLVEGL